MAAASPRAVADARDFLRLAITVTVAVVTDEKTPPEDSPGVRLLECLDRHSITATVAQMQAQRRPVARAAGKRLTAR